MWTIKNVWNAYKSIFYPKYSILKHWLFKLRHFTLSWKKKKILIIIWMQQHIKTQNLGQGQQTAGRVSSTKEKQLEEPFGAN